MAAKQQEPGPGIRQTGDGPALIGTVGHSTRPIEELIAILVGFGATLLVDVRTVPRSRHNPQYNRETLPESLASHGIGYAHEPALGGLRHPRKDSINGAWRNASFRGYADHMQTVEFDEALARLIALASGVVPEMNALASGADSAMKDARPVVMCAEAVPWRCHRSLIADALATRGVTVIHLLGAGQQRAHTLTPFARVTDGRVTYPGVLDLPDPRGDGAC
jgi:uncharacterized protein (DUF488 family)